MTSGIWIRKRFRRRSPRTTSTRPAGARIRWSFSPLVRGNLGLGTRCRSASLKRDPSHQRFPSGKSHRLNHAALAVDAAQFELGSPERVLLLTKQGRGKGRAASRKIPAFQEKPSALDSQKL